MDVISDDESTHSETGSIVVDTSLDEEANDSVFVPTRQKKVHVIYSDTSTSDDEAPNIQTDSYEKVADTSEEEAPSAQAVSYEEVPETDLSESISVLQMKAPERMSNKLEKQVQINNTMTPRTVKAIIDSDSEVEIIDASSDEEEVLSLIPSARKLAQKMTPSLTSITRNLEKQFSETEASPENQISDELVATVEEYLEQKKKVELLENDLQNTKGILRTVNLLALPDKGEMLITRQDSLERALKMAQDKLSKMKPDQKLQLQELKPVTWNELQAASSTVQPKTFGKKAMETYNAQRALTMDRLHQLHGSIKTCPTEDTFEPDPKGLRVKLMEHQSHALAWLLWREEQKPSGGILADDMGLGKTLTMISLILKSRELQKSNDSSDEENTPLSNRRHKYNGGSLVICPASLIKQWEDEVKKHCRQYLLSVELYHGPKRENKAKTLARYDVVITTYSICMNEFEKHTALNSVYWRRIILDEAHQIKNFKCTTAKAICELSAKSRWVLTGTPVHNKELDMYSLLKFLRCSPFDDLAVWKRWVSDKNHGGQERLHTVLSSLMLRRTKQQLQAKGTLMCLPERHWEQLEITLNEAETGVYQKILIFSRTLFAQFLHQRAEKDTAYTGQPDSFNYAKVYGANAEYHKMHKMLLKLNKVRTVKQHDILVLLLRLRQICCHPSLITGMLQDDDGAEIGDDEEHQQELDILEQLNKLNMDDNIDNSLHNHSINDDNEQNNLAQNCRMLLSLSNPVFSEQYESSKIKTVISKLRECVLQNEDKAVVISQFTSFLKILAVHLKKENIRFQQLDGSVPVHKRRDIVSDFNNPRDSKKILLLSLTAGGVGLNLIGGNHLFLLDLHWNPQLEIQAQDRIYRVGQLKTVYVYKFITTDTIEQRIKQLQEKKLDIANSMLTGAKLQQSKLSLEDLKMLFNM